MNHGAVRVRLAVALLAAFVLHASLGPSLSAWGARPNLALACLLVACLFVGRNTGAAFGLLVGLLEASYAAVYVGSLLVTRTVSGWTLGALEERLFRDSPVVALAAVLLGTLLTEGCFYLFAPQPHVMRWAARTGAEALYNTVLALPLYYLLRRMVRPRTP